MKHDWIKDENGEIDYFAFCIDGHNGPKCAVCDFIFCYHCDNKLDVDTCPGPEAMPRINAEHYVYYVKDALREDRALYDIAFKDPVALRDDERMALLPLLPAVAHYNEWMVAVRRQAEEALGAEVVKGLAGDAFKAAEELTCEILHVSRDHFPYDACSLCGFEWPIEWPKSFKRCPGCGARVKELL